MSDKAIDINTIHSTFKDWQSSLNGDSGLAINKARTAAMELFGSRGFPGRKKESWKYTNLEKILKMGFTPIADFKPGEINSEAFDSLRISSENAYRLVFVDGHFNADYSDVPEIAGFEFKTLKEANSICDRTSELNDGLADLNTAFAVDGAVVDIADGAVIDVPIEIYNITTCPGTKMIQPRHRITVGKSAQATFVESYHNLCVGQSFTNCVNTIEIGANANVKYIKIEHPKKPNTFIIDHTMVDLAQDSSFDLYTLTLSGALVRNNLNIRLLGENISTNLFGLYVLETNEHADNHTVVDHAMPNCYSNELYKGILDGTSTGVFNGKIIVRQDAQKTNAYQNNRNILVSDEATVNTMPQLEIYADDVKCSHGATSTQIQDNELFYLRTRGIGKEVARKLLMYAFAGEIWASIKEPEVRSFIEREVSHSMGMELD